MQRNRKLLKVAIWVFGLSMVVLGVGFLARSMPLTPMEVIGHLVVMLLLPPIALVAVGVIVISLFGFFQPGRKGPLVGAILLCLPLPCLMVSHFVRQSIGDPELARWDQWFMLAYKVHPLLLDYHKEYPGRFRYVTDSRSEEVLVDGFVEYAKSRIPDLSVETIDGVDRIVDSWGKPIRYVMSRGDDEKITVGDYSEWIKFSGGVGAETRWENPHGLGIAQQEPRERIYQGYKRATIVVNKGYGFTKQYQQDHPNERP
ncbi:MAG TPA: hypothetical protein VLE43_14895 [Candidatus Saccharimonadia bacterium]|nr:hypothetical protein [Candidatus Saccharimonadia bacterium]